MSTKTITANDLRKVKGVGPTKAKNIEDALTAGANTVEELASIDGVSTNLAASIISFVETGKVPTPEPRKPRKRTAKKATAKKAATKSAQSNGRVSNGRVILKAGTLRRIARHLDDAEAGKLRNAVADLLDDEDVPAGRL